MAVASSIFAFVFSKGGVSEGFYEDIHRLHNDGSIEVLDVSEFDIKENGKIKFERAMTLPLIGAADGFFLEAFVGLVFFHAHDSSNVLRAIHEIKLDENFIRDLIAKGQPGSSVLFVHVKEDPDLSVFDGLISDSVQGLKIRLSREQESKLEILFHGKRSPEFNADAARMH